MVPANASLSNVVLTPACMRRMSRAFKREAFDIVHVHEPLAPVASQFALAAADCPVVITSHASGGRWWWWGVFFWHVLIPRIDYRIAVSEASREVARRFLGEPFEVIPNGVHLEGAASGEREERIVFIGRNDHRKGLEVLLRAWPQIEARTGARLRVIGADPLSVRVQLRKLAIDDRNIDLLGVVPEDVLVDELLSAKALAAPAVGWESFGMVLTRAFACSTPAVASDIPGYREVAGPETGILVPPGDVDALTVALVDLLQDEPRRRLLGENAYRTAEAKYSWRTIGQRLEEIYGALAAGGIPVPPHAGEASAAAAPSDLAPLSGAPER
jgi:phosphatidylinositol alpha-mannosyltransferase